MVIIGLMGGANSGKSLAATVMVADFGFSLTSFSAPMVNMLRAFGVPEPFLHGALRHVPLPMLEGKTVTEALQSLGTEWGRQHLGRSVWLRSWHSTMADLGRAGVARVVVDDVHSAAEAQEVRRLGGRIVAVHSDRPAVNNHTTETEIGLVDPDWILPNNKGTKDFAEATRKLMAGMFLTHGWPQAATAPA